MMKLELSKRLAAVAALVPQGARLADVGTDHAYLPVRLLQENRLSHVIASDIRPGPLEHARRTARTYGVEDKIDFRLCDGLEGIQAGECDTVTISGMGGETIAGILAQAPWCREGARLILQPQSTQNVLRRFLAANGYCITAESLVQEGERWYVILQARGGEMPLLNAGEELAGRPQTWLEQPERILYLQWLSGVTGRQIQGLKRSGKPEDRSRLEYLTQAQEALNGWIFQIQNGNL